MKLDVLLTEIKNSSSEIEFDNVINTIDNHFIYTPTRFSNGISEDVVINDAGTNEGSCKVFAFAQIMNLDKDQTLACFGQYYQDVQSTPEGDNHANIRTFMKHGWPGIQFDAPALVANTPNLE